MTEVSVLSYNIHKGFSTGGRKFVLDGIRDALATVEADIVCLQEIIGEHERHKERLESWPSVTQLEYLADTRWPHYAYAQNAVYDSGHHGNAILSKYPILSWTNVDLSTNPLERRGLLHAYIDIPSSEKVLHCMCVHMSLFGRSRGRQFETIVSHVEEVLSEEEAVILAGDFNDWRGRGDSTLNTVGLREATLTLSGRRAPTFPARMPMLALDRIYVRSVELREARVLRGWPWSKLSDHSAVLVKVRL